MVNVIGKWMLIMTETILCAPNCTKKKATVMVDAGKLLILGNWIIFRQPVTRTIAENIST